MEVIKISETHIQVNDLHADDMKGYRAFWQKMKNKYHGCEIDFCYHNCEVPVDFMEEIGAVLLETCLETRLTKKNFTPASNTKTTLVTRENFSAFQALHDKNNPEMFWTGEKIARNLNRWHIRMCGENYILMSLWDSVAEIFALEMINENEGKKLLSPAAAFAFDTGKTGVLYMVDRHADSHFAAAQAIGFAVCGSYTAYRGTVK